MKKWDKIKVSLITGKEMLLENSYFKIREERMFCIENDSGEGHCIPVDNISNICLIGDSSNAKHLSSNGEKTLENKSKKRFFSKFTK